MSKKKKTILLIEDDKYLCEMYKESLQEIGFKVSIAYDGVEGMKKIKSENPDLILLDLVLPKKKGLEILREMKKDNKLKEIPVIILSNLGEEEDIKKGIDLGAVDYMVKVKFTPKEVTEKIESYFNQSRG